jgi:hypothetical protein
MPMNLRRSFAGHPIRLRCPRPARVAKGRSPNSGDWRHRKPVPLRSTALANVSKNGAENYDIYENMAIHPNSNKYRGYNIHSNDMPTISAPL